MVIENAMIFDWETDLETGSCVADSRLQEFWSAQAESSDHSDDPSEMIIESFSGIEMGPIQWIPETAEDRYHSSNTDETAPEDVDSDDIAVFEDLDMEEDHWVIRGDARYYFDSKTNTYHTGWMRLNGKRYYFDPETGVMQTGWFCLNDYLFYFGEDGVQRSAYSYLNDKGDETITEIGAFTLTARQKKRITNALKTLGSRDCGFLMLDLETGYGIQYNADQVFYAASSMKGPYVVSTVVNHPEAAESQKHRIDAILRLSSNIDYDNLYYKYGEEHFEAWCEAVETEAFAWTGAPFASCSTRDLAKLWLKNYLVFLSNETMGQWFEDPNASAIHSVLGEKYLTRTKAGWISSSDIVYNATCDAGIVYADSGTYLVAVMSDYPCNQAVLENLVQAIDTVHDQIVNR